MEICNLHKNNCDYKSQHPNKLRLEIAAPGEDKGIQHLQRTKMEEKKESYRNILPHFQQPGQEYFVTWCLKGSVLPKALKRYTIQLEGIQSEIKLAGEQKKDSGIIETITKEYQATRRKYIAAYDKILDKNQGNTINLVASGILEILRDTLLFWEDKRLKNYAFCIMPNHIHWVFYVFEKDKEEKPVFLQDIMQSVKRHSANRINKLLGQTGSLWQKESFDTTIRNREHLMNAINYTLNNPVSACLTKNWNEWKGCWYSPGCGDF